MERRRPTIAVMQELLEQLIMDDSKITVTADTRFVADLGLASLELVGLVFLCEQTFNVKLSGQDALLARMQTVGQAVSAIHRIQDETTRILSDAIIGNELS